MKHYITILAVLLIAVACNKKQPIEMKEGVSLPTVENLTLAKLTGTGVRLTWQMPRSIPDEIEQPLSVQVQLKEMAQLRTITLGTWTLPDAPTSYELSVPDANKSYQITVRLNGRTKVVDPNYSSNIFSLGQTVYYNE